ncbi:XRE family transcriptional regulator [Aeromonas sp. FDAARGOS 1408]|uniref:helix-turn-helix domain-containing protein n=1 Tax=Aeromonas TaxID=642 RepID=UPI0020B439D5|nr:XRE family transcriptional regulator [Aeromonas sp. FDAARGOS 1408]
MKSERIKELRKKHGLTQQKLGELVGASRASVSQWESGEHSPSGDYLIALAKVFGVSAHWLSTGKGSPNPSVVLTDEAHQAARVGNSHDVSERDVSEYVNKLFDEWAKSKSLIAFSGEPLSKTASGGNEDDVRFSNVEPTEIPVGRRVPILSYVQAGHWREMCEQASGFDGNVEYVSASIDIGPRGFGLWLRGNSMTPLFNEGDLVIVDPDESPRPGDYVVAKNGSEGATFKKFRPRGIDENGQEVFELVPLNDDYPSMHSDRQHIEIIGVMVEHRIFRKR